MQISFEPEISSRHQAIWVYQVVCWDWEKDKAEFARLENVEYSLNRVVGNIPEGTILCWGLRDPVRRKSKFFYGILLSSGFVFPITKEQIKNFFRDPPSRIGETREVL